MNHQQFLDKYLGKRVDVDKFPVGAEYQCTDLAHAYVREVWGQDTMIFKQVGGAIDAFYDFGNSFLRYDQATLVLNNLSDPNQVPPQGAILVRASTTSNSYGHIEVVHNAPRGLATYALIEQNGGGGKGQGTGTDAIRIVDRTYLEGNGMGKVLGWLIPKSMNKDEIIKQSNNEMLEAWRANVDRYAKDRGLDFAEVRPKIVELAESFKWDLSSQQMTQMIIDLLADRDERDSYILTLEKHIGEPMLQKIKEAEKKIDELKEILK